MLMGRIIKRVSLAFDWPIAEVWPGSLVACPHGDGESSDCWRLDPPVGEGWQRWETTTEGSPSSPVVATAVELASWAAEAATSFGDVHLSRAHWLRPAHRTRRAA